MTSQLADALSKFTAYALVAVTMILWKLVGLEFLPALFGGTTIAFGLTMLLLAIKIAIEKES